MKLITAKAALYMNTLGDTTEIQQQALTYCHEHDYALTHIYHDTGANQPVLISLKEAMDTRAFHLLIIPSVKHLYGDQLGQMLNFLIDAQEAFIDIICLEPRPIRLFDQGLTIAPLSEPSMATLEDVVRCLRFR